jgi:FAD synthase
VYDNQEKTVEVYIMHDFETHSSEGFYGQILSVELKSFMRAESLFPSFDDLILAIHCDVEASKLYLTKFIN